MLAHGLAKPAAAAAAEELPPGPLASQSASTSASPSILMTSSEGADPAPATVLAVADRSALCAFCLSASRAALRLRLAARACAVSVAAKAAPCSSSSDKALPLLPPKPCWGTAAAPSCDRFLLLPDAASALLCWAAGTGADGWTAGVGTPSTRSTPESTSTPMESDQRLSKRGRSTAPAPSATPWRSDVIRAIAADADPLLLPR